MRIVVEWFGPLRDRAGAEREEIEVPETDLEGIWDFLRPRLGTDLATGSLRAAVDDNLAGWDDRPPPGSRVCFIPPVGGG